MRSQWKATCVAAAISAGMAGGQTYSFDTYVHGEIMQGKALPGMSVSATNPNRAFNLLAVFDTQTLNPTSDPDLVGPPWSGGNLSTPVQVVLGNTLIIAENNFGAADGILDDPDDESSRPAGTINLEFASDVAFFGLDVIDIEGGVEAMSSIDFYLNGFIVGTLEFADLIDPLSPHFDPTIEFGNQTANRIRPVTAASFKASAFDRVSINVGGSSAYDNFVIPAPATAGVFGVLAIVGLRRKR